MDDLVSRELPAEVCERMRRRWSDRSSRRVRTLVTQLARSRLVRESGRMRADIHDGPEQTLQSEAGYSNARPHQPGRRNLLHRTAGPYRWVKMRRTHIEHMLSALPPIATEERTFLIGSSVPLPEVAIGPPHLMPERYGRRGRRRPMRCSSGNPSVRDATS